MPLYYLAKKEPLVQFARWQFASRRCIFIHQQTHKTTFKYNLLRAELGLLIIYNRIDTCQIVLSVQLKK